RDHCPFVARKGGVRNLLSTRIERGEDLIPSRLLPLQLVEDGLQVAGSLPGQCRVAEALEPRLAEVEIGVADRLRELFAGGVSAFVSDFRGVACGAARRRRAQAASEHGAVVRQNPPAVDPLLL